MDSLLRKYIDIIEDVADPVSGKTPEEAMKDPRYISDPAFKAEVDAAASIGTQPPAEEPAAPNVPAPAAVVPVAAPTNVPRTADGVNIANMPASSAAAAPAAAAPAAAAPAAAPNYDTMPFGQAFGAARKAGAKDFMWKGKKYAVQMAPKPVQTATPKPAPKPAPLPGKTPFQGAGQISDNPAAEGRNTGIMKELNAMRRIAGLKDSGT